jgi:hypothetical protein
MYEYYKPLRDLLRNLTLMECLGVCRAYTQFLQHGIPFPSGIQVPKVFEKGVVREWELEVLVKECLLHCPEQGSSDFRDWPTLIKAISILRKLENEVYRLHTKSHDIHHEIFRMSHRQFPWQQPLDTLPTIIRYFKIFSRPDLSELIQNRTGLNACQLYSIGLALCNTYAHSFALTIPVRTLPSGIDTNSFEKFLAYFSMDLANAREQIGVAQSFDEDFAYTMSPLKIRPLLQVRLRDQDCLCAPMPPYLLQRFTEGIYYEIREDLGFAAAFGESFQHYIGEVVNAGCTHVDNFSLLPETVYTPRKEEKRSVDWILSDRTADLFIECKTKRVRLESKASLSSQSFHKDIETMAEIVVQVYKALADAKSGLYPHWKSRSLPIYPLIVTLQE